MLLELLGKGKTYREHVLLLARDSEVVLFSILLNEINLLKIFIGQRIHFHIATATDGRDDG